MDAFEIRRQLINDYSTYVRSFIKIRDHQIDRRVQEELNSGLLWPDPLIQLNPAFEPGDSIDGLVVEGFSERTKNPAAIIPGGPFICTAINPTRFVAQFGGATTF